MFKFLMPADAPVVPGLEKHEMVFAANQPQYNPLRTIRSNNLYRQVLSRWTLTPEQRQEVLDGADIYLELCTFNDRNGCPNPLQPIRMAIGKDVDPTFIATEYSLNTNF